MTRKEEAFEYRKRYTERNVNIPLIKGKPMNRKGVYSPYYNKDNVVIILENNIENYR